MRRHIRGGWVKLRGLSQSGHWPSGNPRYYLRRTGAKPVAMPDAPRESQAFLAAYLSAMEDAPTPSKASHPAGSLGAAITAYLSSHDWQALSAGTRRARRPLLDEIVEKYGRAPVVSIRPTHIRKALASLAPHPANNRLRAWKGVFAWMDATGQVDENHIASMAKRSAPTSDGFKAWTREDLEAFRQHWSHSTQQRLAMELLYRACCSMGDGCRLGPPNVRDGWLTYTRSKSKSLAVVPWVNAPGWFEWTDDLERCLTAQGGGHMVWMVTAKGKARSPKAASQWFSRACTAAGLDAEKSAHGLRKLRGAMFRENGASADQRKAILGHETDSEAERYSKTADAKTVITGTAFSNSHSKVGKSDT